MPAGPRANPATTDPAVFPQGAAWRQGCQRLDRACAPILWRAGAPAWIWRPLSVVSRLGDGWLWAGLLLLTAHGGPAQSRVAVALLLLALLHILLVTGLKHGFKRRRPCECCTGLLPRTRQMDRYSFPSGHTLHAVAFTTVLGQALAPPWIGWLWLFTGLLMLSRLILGLHFLTDVLVGAGLGWLGAHLALRLLSAG